MQGTTAAKAALAVAVGVILTATLTPQSDPVAGLNPWCLVCGDRDLADAILNLILFLPVGAGLVLSGGGSARAILLGTLLSIAIEFSQVFIPGRGPSVRDVLMNMLGTASGTLLVGLRASWFTARESVAPWLGLSAAGLAAAIMLGFGLLLQPSFTTTQYYGQWTQHREGREFYGGRVLEASIGTVSVPDGELSPSEPVRALLADGAEVTVRLVAGPRVEDYAPIFGIADDAEREEVNLGAGPDDLIIRTRSRASRWRLDRPDVRFSGAAKLLVSGEAVLLRASRSGTRWCLGVNQARTCSAGLTPASGWRVLYSANAFPPWLLRMLGLCWLAGMALPVGFWIRRSRVSLLSVALLAGAFAACPFTGLERASMLEVMALLLGLTVGMAGQMLLRSVRRESVAPAVLDTMVPARVA